MKTLTLLAGLSLAAVSLATANGQAAKPAKPAAKPAAAAGKWISPPQAGRPAMKTRPSGDKAIIRTVADAMGFIRGMPPAETTATINRVQLRGSGKVAVNGSLRPAEHYIYTLSLHLKAAREDIQFGKGGPARITRVVLANDAWDEKEPGVDGFATRDSAASRRLQLYRTPFGFTRALLDADPAAVKISDPGPGKGPVTLTFPIDGVSTTATLDPDYRPATIRMTVDGQPVVTIFSGYKDLSEYGLMFPTHWTETVGGKPRLDVKIDDGRVASYAVFPKPAALTASR